MSERLERLQREIAAEREAVLSELGMSFAGPLLVQGDRADAERVIAQRLARIPALLHDEARRRMRASAVCVPWLKDRRIPGATA